MRYDLYIYLRAFENRGKGEVETVGLRRPVADGVIKTRRVRDFFRTSVAVTPPTL